MCGIAGICNFDLREQVDANVLRRMAGTMVHRGPDDEGFFISGSVGLAFRRLSIIDVKGGHQPMSNEDDSVWIIFNGEIYNHAELRSNLQAKGHRYKTLSDTETILHAYEEFGEDCLERLRGMFSFVIWDSKRRRLFMARDRLGIKPLYYSLTETGLVFASEIKALLKAPGVTRSINEEAIPEYFFLGYVAGEETMFRGIYRLSPGHFMVVQDGRAETRRYWDLPVDAPPADGTEDDFADSLNVLLEESVRLRLLSEVPLGAFLSGGIDSSAIVANAAKLQGPGLNTFCVGFGSADSLDELKYARLIAQKFDCVHHESSLDEQDFWNLIRSYIWHMDEPINDAPSIALLSLSREARKHCTVLLSGEGADELFGGYGIYTWMTRTESLRARTGLSAFPSFDQVTTCFRGTRCWFLAPLEDKYWGVKAKPRSFGSRGILTEEFWRSVVSWDRPPAIQAAYERISNRDPLDRMLYVDLKTWLPNNLLTRADKMTMAASIELRVPFLDHKLVEAAFRIPAKFKINGGVSKYIEKRALAQMLPKEILHRKKVGFQTPAGEWMRSGVLASKLSDLLMGPSIARRNYFDHITIRRVVDEHRSGHRDHSDLLWGLLVFELWCRAYIDEAVD